MKILVAHNFYQQAGGEDQVYRDEVALLKSHGHEVFQFEVHNDAIDSMSNWEKLKKTIWNRDLAKQLYDLIHREQIEIAHFHNTFPLISPAAYSAAQQAGAKVVQTLHNFRLLCPNGLFLRDSKPCEQCLNKLIAWPAIKNKCYRNSRSASAAVTSMLAIHRAKGTWQKNVDQFIALTNFAKEKFIAGGLPAEKMSIKGNFVAESIDLNENNSSVADEKYAIYVGRLSEEKGIHTLLKAWQKLGSRINLKIAGDGPLQPLVVQAVKENPAVQWLQHLEKPTLFRQIRQASMLVLPSQCYEGFPKTIAEAYACGTPVVATNHGAMAELVEPMQTGSLFQPGEVHDLITQVDRLLADPLKLKQMSNNAREKYEKQYTAEANYRQLLNVYHSVLGTFPAPNQNLHSNDDAILLKL